MTDQALSIWFLLHDLFLRPTAKPSKLPTGEPGQAAPRCHALIELMENGPLGEFVTRWRLLAALYPALSVWPGLSDRGKYLICRLHAVIDIISAVNV